MGEGGTCPSSSAAPAWRPAPGRSRTPRGAVLGTHRGTGASRSASVAGLGLAAEEPLYVLATDAGRNAVVVGPREALATHRLSLEPARVAGDLGEGPLDVRVRYRGRPLRGRAVATETGLSVELDDSADGVAPGQTAALYRDGLLVAAGTIAAPEGSQRHARGGALSGLVRRTQARAVDLPDPDRDRARVPVPAHGRGLRAARRLADADHRRGGADPEQGPDDGGRHQPRARAGGRDHADGRRRDEGRREDGPDRVERRHDARPQDHGPRGRVRRRPSPRCAPAGPPMPPTGRPLRRRRPRRSAPPPSSAPPPPAPPPSGPPDPASGPPAPPPTPDAPPPVPRPEGPRPGTTAPTDGRASSSSGTSSRGGLVGWLHSIGALDPKLWAAHA